MAISILCRSSCRGFQTNIRPTSISRTTQKISQKPSIRYQPISNLPPHRPSLTVPASSFRPPLSSSAQNSPLSPSPGSLSSTSASAGAMAIDVLPKISQHPALASIQVRCGPRNTFNPSHLVRKRRHGFLARAKTRKGRMILKRRRLKGRSTLSH